MTLLYLVRHVAHAEQGHRLVGRLPGIALGEAGRQQLVSLRDRLAGTGFAAVLSGPLERATATARHLGEPLGLPVTISPALDEVDYGDWTGRDIAGFGDDPVWRAWNLFRAGTRVPGGETMLEVQARVVALIERLCREHPAGRLLLVSHGDVIRAALLFYLGLSLDLFLQLEIDPGSLSILAVEPWGARLLRLNENTLLP